MNDKNKEILAKLIGKLFGAWSLLDIKASEMEKKDENDEFLYREPNNCQILALLLIFGCDSSEGFM